MSLVESAGAPFASAASNSLTSASFTPNANSLLVTAVSRSNGLAQGGVPTAVTDTSGQGSWKALVQRAATSSQPWSDCSVWIKDAGPSPVAMTVSATSDGSPSTGMIVRQFAGAAPAQQQNGATRIQAIRTGSCAIVPTTAGSQIVGAMGDAGDQGPWSALGNTIFYGQFNGTSGDSGFVFEASALSSAGQITTLGTQNGTSFGVVFALAEILPALPFVTAGNFNDVAVNAVLDKIVSYALASGRFDAVNQHEPKNAPGNQVTFALWIQRIRPVPRGSGLSATSGILLLTGRVYQNFRSQPFDAIDPSVTAATLDLMGKLTADFGLQGVPSVRNIDLLGQYGIAMDAQAGYVEIDKSIYRVVTIQIPVIINDMFVQVA